MASLNSGILNSYVKKPKNLTEYTAYRGVTDFTQIGQFSQFETGYNFLSVISMPKWLERAAKIDPTNVGVLINSFKHMLEYEFRGMDGLPDISVENSTITNGIQEVQMINKVVEDTSITVTMQYYEKTGSPITRFSEYYLTGIKDKRTQAKTYHGLIAQGEMEPGYENEVFTMLYYVTDNTYTELERAVLLTNAQLTKAETSIYNGQKGEISNKEMTIEFQCFPVTGELVDKAAKALLQQITGIKVSSTAAGTTRSVVSTDNVAVLDSSSYNYKALENLQ
jgi:hypothetical protein